MLDRLGADAAVAPATETKVRFMSTLIGSECNEWRGAKGAETNTWNGRVSDVMLTSNHAFG